MNHRHALREIAKIGFGLVLADLISVFWFASAGVLPATILGVTWTSAQIPGILVFDVALLILLAHLGWNMHLPVHSPSERTLLVFAGIVFLVIALAHLARAMFSVGVILGGFAIPLWLSWAGFVITLYLSYSCFHFALHGRRS